MMNFAISENLRKLQLNWCLCVLVIGASGTASGQILHWKLDETSGTTFKEEVSGLSNVASSVGSVSLGTAGLAPDGGTAITLASNPTGYIDAGTLKSDDSYVSGVAASPKILTDNWTVTAWVNAASTSGQDRMIISSEFSGGNSNFSLLTRNANSVDNNLVFEYSNERDFSGISIQPDTDYFVAFSFDDSDSGSEGRYAVWDGTTWSYSDTATTKNGMRLDGLEIGSFGTGQRQFVGTIDDVQIFDTTLSDQDLIDLINPAAVPEPGTIAIWLITALGLLGYGIRRRWQK